MKARARQDTDKARLAMLAKVHIGQKELCIDDATYRIILMDMFGVQSAAQLSVGELERLVKRFESKGWRPSPRPSPARGEGEKRIPHARGEGEKSIPHARGEGEKGNIEAQARLGGQVEALKERIGQEVLNSDLTELRLRGLVRKICGVDDLQWCGDAVRLKWS